MYDLFSMFTGWWSNDGEKQARTRKEWQEQM